MTKKDWKIFRHSLCDRGEHRLNLLTAQRVFFLLLALSSTVKLSDPRCRIGERVAVFDGSFHPVDSSEICFKIAGAGALKKALSEAQPILLENVWKILKPLLR